jgi:exosome complex exonuclease DIS3/RRP44
VGSKAFPAGHYLVPDTNAFLTGMDLFEVETAFKDVIVLQTVLEEVKNRSLPLYHRLVSLTKNEDKRFYVFFNEFRKETYVTRDSGESINDRNDRAVRRAVSWYHEHLQNAVATKKSSKCPAVVMISDDRDCLRKAKVEKTSALSRTLPTFALEIRNTYILQFMTMSQA